MFGMFGGAVSPSSPLWHEHGLAATRVGSAYPHQTITGPRFDPQPRPPNRAVPLDTKGKAVAATVNISDVGQWLAESERTTVLTGAGISTASGIPDFRGPQGLWTRNPGAAAMFDIDIYRSDVNVRREVWRMRRDSPALTAEPNEAHRALVDLDRTGRLLAVITQNIDGLHQKAGLALERVLEVHGTIHEVECLSCGRRVPTPDVLARLDEESDPRCLACGGIQKAATISFGQRLDPDVLDAAITAAKDCDLFLTVGTSLTVHPVAGLCDIAREHGARLVIINAEPTPYDEVADAVLRDPVETVLPELVQRAVSTA
jgi:NAD-dependent deacetylase